MEFAFALAVAVAVAFLVAAALSVALDTPCDCAECVRARRRDPMKPW